MILTKRERGLTRGPVAKSGMDNLAPRVTEGTVPSGLQEILAAVSGGIPDFTDLILEIDGLEFDPPDDPMLVGLDTTKRMLHEVAHLKRILATYRSEALTIRAAWKELMADVDHVENNTVNEIKGREEYRGQRNAEFRQDYINRSLGKIPEVRTIVTKAIHRCDAFIEICRIRGKALESSHEALSRQVTVVDQQIRLRHYLPRGEEGEE